MIHIDSHPDRGTIGSIQCDHCRTTLEGSPKHLLSEWDIQDYSTLSDYTTRQGGWHRSLVGRVALTQCPKCFEAVYRPARAMHEERVNKLIDRLEWHSSLVRETVTEPHPIYEDVDLVIHAQNAWRAGIELLRNCRSVTMDRVTRRLSTNPPQGGDIVIQGDMN